MQSLFILSTIHGSIYLVTERQAVEIVRCRDSGVQTVKIGKAYVSCHQIAEICPADTFYRNDRMALAAKHLRRCKRCYMVVGMGDPCPCKDDRSGQYLPILEASIADNPALQEAKEQLLNPGSEPII